MVFYVGRWLWSLMTKAGKQAMDKDKDKARDRVEGLPDAAGHYDELYTTAYQEVSTAKLDTASWAKAFASAAGDNDKAKALYIKYRVEQLKNLRSA